MLESDRSEAPGRDGLDGLSTALAWLDALLDRAAAAARELYGPGAAGDPYRGMLVGHDEPARLLAREPGVPLFSAGQESDTGELDDPLAALRLAFGLADFDVAVCVIALAPELDLRYERLYGYLQDDVGRRRPTVDLALNLLCADVAGKLAGRARFAPQAPLIRHGLIELVTDPRHAEPPLLARQLRLDDQVVALLLRQTGLGDRLAGVARLVEAPAAGWPESLPAATVDLARGAASERRALSVWIEGARGSGRRGAAEGLAAALGRPLLELDAARLQDGGAAAIASAFRYARFAGALLHVHAVEALGDEARPMLDAVAGAPGPVVLSGTPTARPTADVLLALPELDPAGRRSAWALELDRAGVEAADDVVDALAGRFRLDPAQIGAAAARVAADRGLAANGRSATTGAALFAAARAQTAGGLGPLGRKVEPTRAWDDLVLPPEPLAQLRELCAWMRHRTRVYQEWGFRRRLGPSLGLNALFSGPPGTGKTLAAQVIAGDLGIDLYRIDLAAVVSKYIGDTEKNLARVFDAAQDSNAILLFDEADALFGKRTEVRDSHDRFANVEISYLLQRMEEYDGIAILTTNRRRDLDEAFMRRLQFAVEFPLPDAADRRRIWTAIWPAETPRSPDVDADALARRFELPGGNIRNIALAAAFLAAGDGQVVKMAHVLAAARREYRKLGMLADEGQFDDED